ncbi:hypothetical protein TYRP_002838 [Tyrophagus putrescentiae]|nr:hypothetical protein TYRP_002838 [Tyrophagus putrescentiae]
MADFSVRLLAAYVVAGAADSAAAFLDDVDVVVVNMLGASETKTETKMEMETSATTKTTHHSCHGGSS